MAFLRLRDHRAEPRRPTTIPVRVTILSPSRTLTGRMIDFSGRGLGLLLDEFVMFQTRVEVHWQGGGAYGEIRHCQIASGGEYSVGVQIARFMPGTQPSEASVR